MKKYIQIIFCFLISHFAFSQATNETVNPNTAANAFSVKGTISSTTPGGFSAGVRGQNNGTGGLGIGVYGSQNGSGWGVYGSTPSGIAVNGFSTSGYGIYGSSASGIGLYGNSTSNFALLTSGNVNMTNGNVGIDQATPTYKLHVTHSGSTGILSQSTASFSLVDIDAASGDAALRFQRAGVNQWNVRNRPGDDYFEIFELGGGGSRVVIQDATGNVGIGETTSPTYKLDVLHGGSTGIRSRSSGSFSVVDIDAASGDAALRFQKAGVNQWNVRNRPADDYFEIFELGGGGSRVVIQDATGNVGIGETTNPTYKLDVLHGGATGIRSRSSGTFSVIDIDGANGDAALRFQKAGVNQWNIRNNPANDDLQFFELGGGGERMRIENTTGNVVINGNLSKGGGSFKIDHPIEPENKYLYHSFVESPDMMNIYNGNIVTDASGRATVKLPDYFEALNMDYRYQLTVIGSFAQAIIEKEVSENTFEIATNKPNVKVSWQVTGIRQDAFAKENRIPNVQEKETFNKGKYLHPRAFGKPDYMGIGYITNNDKNKLRGTGNEASSIDDLPVPTLPLTTKATVIQGTSLEQKSIVAPVTNKIEDVKGSSLEQKTLATPQAPKIPEVTKQSTDN